MNDLLESMRQSWVDPITRHAILVHTPIVIGLFAIPFVAALVFISGRKAVWYRVVLGTMLFLTAVIAWQATEAGEAASTIVETRLGSGAGIDVLESHATKGERIPLLLAATSLLVFATLAKPRGLKLCAGIAAAAAILGTAATTIVTAHEGGMLVYRFGVAKAASTTGGQLVPTANRSSGDPSKQSCLVVHDDRLPATPMPIGHLALEVVAR